MKANFSLRQSNIVFFVLTAVNILLYAMIQVMVRVNSYWVLKNSVLIECMVPCVFFLMTVGFTAGRGVSFKSAVGLNMFSFGHLLLALVAAPLTYIAGRALSLFIALFIPPSLGAGGSLAVFSPAAVVFITCVLLPVTDGFIYRGVLFSGFESRLGVGRAALATGLIYAFMQGNILSVPAAVVAGVAFALTAGYSRSLFTSVIMHGLYAYFAYSGFIDQYIIYAPSYFANPRVMDIVTIVWIGVLLLISAWALAWIFATLRHGWMCRRLRVKALTEPTGSGFPHRGLRTLGRLLPPNDDEGAGLGFFLFGTVLMVAFALANTFTYLWMGLG